MANKFPVEEVSVVISRAAIKLRYSQLKAKQYKAVSEKHLGMKNIMERAEDYSLEESILQWMSLSVCLTLETLKAPLAQW